MTELFDNILNDSKLVNTNTNAIKQITICTNCESNDLINENDSIICKDCGLILSDQIFLSNYNFDDQVDVKKGSSKFNKISKMQQWMEYTNEEKNIYKLRKYTRILCEKLEVYENLIDIISDLVVNIMNKIKKNDGPKRSRVKDGIIIVCIYYISKKHNYNCIYISLAKKIKLDIKYITKADRILMEIMNCDENNTLNIDKTVLFKQEKPIEYINTVITKYKLNEILKDQTNIILEKTEILINICEDNDLLTDHIPLSIGVCCFYYILIKMKIDINMNLFLQMFNITNITIMKIYNKLQEYDDKLEELLFQKK